ncbi:methyl-accepting chemotaxis protein [Anaerobaca lacustris]|uniref:Methyl-accepting chemotaxis protein n=1 Tax=Anaerobaca lacustris TaxID=3044600 RepID=A0AAW6TZE8_9BACT|nr:methyl-accepting chemotaxis protein [Sedimentisphaerales bacterium M17dextr]
MTIGRKLALGFGVVLVLLTLTGVIAFRGVSGMETDAEEVIHKNVLVKDLSQGEIAHLNWANQVVALITDESITQLSVETDHHKCAFGQWLYSDARKEAERQVPELASILKEIERPHQELHESAIEIDHHFQQADAVLPGLLATRMVDHLKWADLIRDAFLNGKTSLEVETDPTRCALGQWLTSAEGKKAYEEAGPELKRAWDQMLVVHRALHESAVDVCRHIAEGEQGRVAAKKVFDERTMPLLEQTLGHMEQMKLAAEQALEGQNLAKQVLVTKTKPCLHTVQGLLHQAVGCVDEVVTRTNDGMMASARLTKWSVGVLSVVAVAIGIVAAVLIARGILSALTKIIASLKEGSEQVAAASGQVSAASQSLAEGATEQAAGLEETSSSLEEMSSMTKQNADNAQQANALAGEARKAADTGAESMTRMSKAINDIQKSSDETAKIIKVIDEIAFQTNLLALNAAVEAARAGEAGKGFAVVAEEVRNLAMRSAEAAKNTANMIEESVKNSKNGVDIATEVGKVLEQIVQSVGKTTNLVGEIAAASQEQAQGIDQVNTAVSQMDKVTQQNAANAEESASASEELSSQAESMNEIVGELVALVGGASGKPRSAGPQRGGRRGELSRSDHVYHDIASAAPARTPKAKQGHVAKPAVKRPIPLDEDERLDHFNS